MRDDFFELAQVIDLDENNDLKVADFFQGQSLNGSHWLIALHSAKALKLIKIRSSSNTDDIDSDDSEDHH